MIDTEHDIIVEDLPIITPNGDIVVSSLSFKVYYQDVINVLLAESFAIFM